MDTSNAKEIINNISVGNGDEYVLFIKTKLLKIKRITDYSIYNVIHIAYTLINVNLTTFKLTTFKMKQVN